MKCSSCGVQVSSRKNFVRFSCPGCGESEIVRCFNCKALSSNYECPLCKFVGP